LDLLDDLHSPKRPGPSCEYCPFDFLCDGLCVLGWTVDMEMELAQKTVAS